MSTLDLQPVVFLDEVWHRWESPDTVGQAYAEADQPLFGIPRVFHERVALEQVIDGQLRVVVGQNTSAIHLMDCLNGLYCLE